MGTQEVQMASPECIQDLEGPSVAVSWTPLPWASLVSTTVLHVGEATSGQSLSSSGILTFAG